MVEGARPNFNSQGADLDESSHSDERVVKYGHRPRAGSKSEIPSSPVGRVEGRGAGDVRYVVPCNVSAKT